MSVERAALADVLNFSAEDLAANRAGNLSNSQKARLARGWQRTVGIIVGLVVGFGLLATILLFLGQRNESPILSIIGVIITVVNAVLVGLGAQSYLRTTSDLRGGRVAVLDGVVSHTIRVTGRAATYILKVDAQEIIVPKVVFFAFEESKPYRLYRAPASRTLLSAEPK
ncbi:MAG: hypothetical protein IT319_06325 [Anaerolineae bacterium]|nr:hypothetical protein [Anaerolineae bacterium]